MSKQVEMIEAYSLFEFCTKVQEAMLKGFRFDFNSNDLFPTAFGSLLVTGMVKLGADEGKQEMLPEEPKVETQEETQVEPEEPKGRKKK